MPYISRIPRFFPLLVANKTVRARQMELLRRAAVLLEAILKNQKPSHDFKLICVALYVVYGLSGYLPHMNGLPDAQFDSSLFQDPYGEPWKTFIRTNDVLVQACKRNLFSATGHQLDVLLSIVRLALCVEDILAEYHKQARENGLMWDELGPSTFWNTRDANQREKGRDNGHGVAYALLERTLAPESEGKTTLYPLVTQVPGVVRICKQHAAILLAASVMGLVVDSSKRSLSVPPGDCRNLFQSYLFSAWVFTDDPIELEKLKCIFSYFSVIFSKMPLEFCNPGVAQTSSSNGQEKWWRDEITIRRIVGPSVVLGLRPTAEPRSRDKDARLSLSDYIKTWETAQEPLQPVTYRNIGGIEDCDGCIMVDFANKRIGGGVFGKGCVQEEIFFVTFPELLISMLCATEMNDNEAVLIQGAERFVEHTGYHSRFRCMGPVTIPPDSGAAGNRFSCVPYNRFDNTPRQRETAILAVDAYNFAYQNPGVQFTIPYIMRELLKLYTGGMLSTGSENGKGALAVYSSYVFAVATHVNGMDDPHGKRVPLATGNWGAGVFRGNPQLKFIIQWLAGSRARRPIVYFGFDHPLMKRMPSVTKALVDKYKTVGRLYRKCIEVATLYDSRQQFWDCLLEESNKT